MTALHHPTRADYEPNVLAFLPGAEGDELQHRASLLLMRDRALATKPIATEQAWYLLDLVERTAGEYAFKPMPADALAELRRLLIMCVANASGFNALFAPELPMGGESGRG